MAAERESTQNKCPPWLFHFTPHITTHTQHPRHFLAAQDRAGAPRCHGDPALWAEGGAAGALTLAHGNLRPTRTAGKMEGGMGKLSNKWTSSSLSIFTPLSLYFPLCLCLHSDTLPENIQDLVLPDLTIIQPCKFILDQCTAKCVLDAKDHCSRNKNGCPKKPSAHGIMKGSGMFHPFVCLQWAV